ncbi:Acyl-CoA-binding domain-containing protein 5, partial [Quaeritorhiza haematococci]
ADAMSRYITLVESRTPWKQAGSDSATSQMSAPTSSPSSSSNVMGVSVSTMAREDDHEEIQDEDKTIFDWCAEGASSKVCALLDENPESVHQKDDQGLTPLHIACDRGHLDLVKELVLSRGADINTQDLEGQTPLHY